MSTEIVVEKDRYAAVAMLHNIAANRFHPILFRYAPAPSEDFHGTSKRAKSIGHHTEGFATSDEAWAFIADRWTFDAERRDVLIPWDGESSPHSVVWIVSGRLML